MRIDRNEAFRQLEPPPGGAAKLRARFGSRSGGLDGHVRWLGPVAVASVAAIAIFAFQSSSELEPSVGSNDLMKASAFDRLLGRDSVPFELRVSRGTESLTVSELAASNPGVRLYTLSEAEQTEAP